MSDTSECDEVTQVLATTDMKIRGGTIRVLDSGTRGAPVLFFHGNSGSADLFRPLLARVSQQGFRAMAISFPGHGGSQPSNAPESDYSVPELAACIVEVVEQLALSRYVLVGHSLGGHAVSTALPRLKGVAGIFLVSAPPVSPSTMPAVFRPDPTGGAMFGGRLTEHEQRRFRDALLDESAEVSQEVRDALLESIRTTDIRFRPALLASIVAGRLADERANVERTTIPTCLAFGRRDRFLLPDSANDLALRAPFAEGIHYFGDSGHCPHLEMPDAFAALLGNFLRATLTASC